MIKNKKEASTTKETEQFLKIPKRIVFNTKLNNAQKMLFGVLNGFLEKQEHVIYPNNKLSIPLNCSESSVDRDLKVLEKNGIIKRIGPSYRRKIHRGKLFFNTDHMENLSLEDLNTYDKNVGGVEDLNTYPKNEGGVEDLNTCRKNAEVLPQKCGGTTAKMGENIDIEIDYLHNKNQNPKEIKNKEKSSSASPSTPGNVVKLPAVKKLENEVAVNPNYTYPETYFGEGRDLPDVSEVDVSVASYVQGLPEEQQKKELDIPISVKQSLVIAQKQVSKCDMVTTEDIVNALCWWMMYPVKQNYRKWIASWFAEGCHKKHKELVIILGEQLEKDQRMKSGYAPNPATYILDARYEDKIYAPQELKVVSHNDTSWADESKRSIFETW